MDKKTEGRKKSTKKRFSKNKYYLLLGIAVLIVILLFILLVKSLFNFFGPDYYTVENRNNQLEQRSDAAKDKDADYDVVGWVKVQGTKIDFPVISRHDENSHNPVETTAYGWLSNPGDTEYHNVLNIYGHNVMNLSEEPIIYDDSFERFEELLSFTDYEFAKKNLYFQYTMNGEEHLYKIFAVDILYASSMKGLPEGDYSEKELTRYIDMVKENSIFDYNVKVSSDDDIISLITCTGLNSNGIDYNDIVITGKKVVAGEKANAYSVKKTDKYKEIVKKGDD